MTIEQNTTRTAHDQILIVADDLTGACDSAVAFAAVGWRTRVLLDTSAQLSPVAGAAVTAVCAETRNLPSSQAASRVSHIVASLHTSSTLLFLKIDSAARGNMVSEVPAALSSSHSAAALVTPAFPAAGRTVRGGTLYIRDFAGQDTSIDLRTIFPVGEVLFTGSVRSLEHGIHNALARNVRILLCNAITQKDLEYLATAALRIPQPLLWAGSSGLARALAASLSVPAISAEPQPAAPCGRTILFVGTEHAVTTQQVEHLRERYPASLIHSVDFTSASEQAILNIFRESPVASLILTGGDTAAFVLRVLGAHAIALTGEVSPGIPYGRIEGGLADGCTVVTKSGGFGEREALLNAIHFCERTTLASA